jgi:ABC-2 type transport system ATP-binding protein
MVGIEIENLSHSWGNKHALDSVSFRVDSGRFCALLGPNGAGKSTLFGLLTGLFIPQSGRVYIAGHDVTKAPRLALSQLGVVFQQQTLDLDLTVWRNMLYFAGLHGMSGKTAKLAAAESLDRLGMVSRGSERVRDLNGGHRRRLEIARSLMHRPSVLLMDEPTVGLDAHTRSAITDHAHELASDLGLCVLWATHLTDEVRQGDSLVILDQGRVLESGQTTRTGSDLTDHFLTLTRNSQQAA